MPKLTNAIAFILMMMFGGTYIAVFANLPLPMEWMKELAALAPIQITVLIYLWYRSKSHAASQEPSD